MKRTWLSEDDFGEGTTRRLQAEEIQNTPGVPLYGLSTEVATFHHQAKRQVWRWEPAMPLVAVGWVVGILIGSQVCNDI